MERVVLRLPAMPPKRLPATQEKPEAGETGVEILVTGIDSKGSPEIGHPSTGVDSQARMGASPLRAIRQATLAGIVRTFENRTAGTEATDGFRKMYAVFLPYVPILAGPRRS
jgi:hypothetical protein